MLAVGVGQAWELVEEDGSPDGIDVTHACHQHDRCACVPGGVVLCLENKKAYNGIASISETLCLPEGKIANSLLN